MVQLEEVPDDELNAAQPGPGKEDEDEWDTDSGNAHAEIEDQFKILTGV